MSIGLWSYTGQKPVISKEKTFREAPRPPRQAAPGRGVFERPANW